jgi:hypothetical protein
VMVRSGGHIAALTAVQSIDPHHLRRSGVSTASRGFEPASTNSDQCAQGRAVCGSPQVTADRLGGGNQRPGFRPGLHHTFSFGGSGSLRGSCGAGCPQPPRRVKTARRMRLCANKQRAACACLGLDRRGRMKKPARTPTPGWYGTGGSTSLLTNNTASLKAGNSSTAFPTYRCGAAEA